MIKVTNYCSFSHPSDLLFSWSSSRVKQTRSRPARPRSARPDSGPCFPGWPTVGAAPPWWTWEAATSFLEPFSCLISSTGRSTHSPGPCSTGGGARLGSRGLVLEETSEFLFTNCSQNGAAFKGQMYIGYNSKC